MEGSHYFSPDPSAPSRPRRVRLSLPDLTLDLATDSGVFSPDRIDPGTRILLAEAPDPDPGLRTLVDLGAGYGPVALTLARRHPAATVWAVEPNRRARELCRTNAAEAGLDNVAVVAPEEVPSDLVIDALWSNPPIRIGKVALRELLVEWLGRLRPGARARLVVSRNLGADSLARWLNDAGWTTTRVASRQSYRLLEVCAHEHSELD